MSLETRRYHFGAESLQAAASLQALAAVLLATGRLADAEAHCRRCLLIRYFILPFACKSCCKCILHALQAGVHLCWSRFDAKEQHWRKLVLYGSEMLWLCWCRGAKLPGEGLEAASGWQLLGEVLLANGQAADAEAAFRRCLAAREQRLGPQHPDFARPLLGEGLSGVQSVLACLHDDRK